MCKDVENDYDLWYFSLSVIDPFIYLYIRCRLKRFMGQSRSEAQIIICNRPQFG